MENEQVTPQETVQPKSETKEQVVVALKQILELKEPVFLPRLAEKLSKRLSLIYIIGLVVLILSMFSSLVSLFYTPIIGFCNMIMTAVWFVVFRMLCETFLTSAPATEAPIEAPEDPEMPADAQ